MSQHIRGISREQVALLPAAVEDYVGADSLPRVIDGFVKGLNLRGLGFVRSEAAHTGRPGYAPDDCLKLYLTDYYQTKACADCAQKAQCTEAKQRSIARSWYAEAMERAKAHPALMRLRSGTAEHPFGNLKAMLAGGFLVRTLPKVKGEIALAVLTYNLKRVLAILGFEKLTQKLAAATAFAAT